MLNSLHQFLYHSNPVTLVHIILCCGKLSCLLLDAYQLTSILSLYLLDAKDSLPPTQVTTAKATPTMEMSSGGRSKYPAIQESVVFIFLPPGMVIMVHKTVLTSHYGAPCTIWKIFILNKEPHAQISKWNMQVESRQAHI